MGAETAHSVFIQKFSYAAESWLTTPLGAITGDSTTEEGEARCCPATPPPPRNCVGPPCGWVCANGRRESYDGKSDPLWFWLIAPPPCPRGGYAYAKFTDGDASSAEYSLEYAGDWAARGLRGLTLMELYEDGGGEASCVFSIASDGRAAAREGGPPPAPAYWG